MSLHTHLYVKTCAATEPGITANVRCCGTLVLALLLTQLLPDATCVSHQRTAKSVCHAYCHDFSCLLSITSHAKSHYSPPLTQTDPLSGRQLGSSLGEMATSSSRLRGLSIGTDGQGFGPENSRKMSKMDNHVIRNKGSLQRKDENRIMFVLTAVVNKFWELEARQMMTTAKKIRINDCERHGHPSAESQLWQYQAQHPKEQCGIRTGSGQQKKNANTPNRKASETRTESILTDNLATVRVLGLDDVKLIYKSSLLRVTSKKKRINNASKAPAFEVSWY